MSGVGAYFTASRLRRARIRRSCTLQTLKLPVLDSYEGFETDAVFMGESGGRLGDSEDSWGAQRDEQVLLSERIDAYDHKRH